MLADAPAGGQRAMIELAARRFFCGNPGCPAKTFAEQVAGLTGRHAQAHAPEEDHRGNPGNLLTSSDPARW
jgi:hypothetical protein